VAEQILNETGNAVAAVIKTNLLTNWEILSCSWRLCPIKHRMSYGDLFSL